jgi:CBS domain-containing protein
MTSMTPNPVRARDLMRTDVAILAPGDTIESALALFEEARISGAPVVSDGRLVGVLTLADVSRTEHLSGDRMQTRRESDLAEPVGEERTDELDPEEVFYSKEDYSAELLGRDLVGDWMTSEAVTVAPDAPLERICRTMVENRIHRVFVAEEQKLVGLISSFDIVRLVAGGRREPRPARRPRARE